MSAVSLGEAAIVETLRYTKLEPPVGSIERRFPVQTGKTVSKDNVVMMNNSGEVYPIENSGNIPFELPIGLPYTWGLGTNPQNPTNTHFVAEKEFIINLEAPGIGSQLLGGSVDALGNFTYGTPSTISGFPFTNPFSIASAIDTSTYDSPVVNGMALSFFNTGTYAAAFSYNRASKTFTTGSVIQIGNVGGSYPGIAITSIGADRYIVSSSSDKEVYLLTVSGTTTTKTTTLSVPNMYQRSAITKISDTKVVVLYEKNNWKTDAQIVNISGAALSLGNLATSTYDNYNNFFTTPILSLDNKFYPTNNINNGFGSSFGLYEYSYDSGTDTITINNTPIVEPTGDFSATDLAYYQPTNRIIASGSSGSNPAILIVDFNNSAFAPSLLSNAGGGASASSSAIDDDGDIVVVYNNLNNGVSTYGRIGNIISNLDPTKRIGVADESSSSLVGVKLAGSIATAPFGSGLLTPNGSVFVSQQGGISGTTSFEALNIGKAISSTQYILN